MPEPAPNRTAPRARRATGSLVEALRESLRAEISAGTIAIGAKLPSEARLTERFGVSRTVVREAIASLRADGLVEPRQGAGVFVRATITQAAPIFPAIDPEKISHMIEILELRSAVEIEAAGLAAARRSPAQDEEIAERCRAVDARVASGAPTSEADFAFHLAIAEATNNPRFREFLEMLGRRVIPRAALHDEEHESAPSAYLVQIAAEHRALVEAISARDEIAAREAMRVHLIGSQQRYRALLRQARD